MASSAASRFNLFTSNYLLPLTQKPDNLLTTAQQARRSDVTSLVSDLKTPFSLSLFHAGPSKEDTSSKKTLAAAPMSRQMISGSNLTVSCK